MPVLTHLVVGQISRPHGIQGELKARAWTDDSKRLEHVKVVYTKQGDDYTPHTVIRCRADREVIRWQWADCTTTAQAESWRGAYVYVTKQDAAPLEEGAHYIAELVGCRVVDESSRELGILKEVFRTGSNDVYVVETNSKQKHYLPVIRDVVKSIDLEKDLITVDATMVLESEEIK